jgi:predicted O-methyltransferase YrrM
MLDWKRWYEGKVFTSDWSSIHFDTWTKVLSPLRDQEIKILEIGSWEGRSAIFFLEFFPKCHLTCVDTFAGSSQHPDTAAIAGCEGRFDANLAPYKGRVEKIKSRSIPALDRLGQNGSAFDLIYVDGSHTRDDVMADSVLSWYLLRQDGILIWDDYLWGTPPVNSPKHAVDAFLTLHSGEFTLLQAGEQVIVQRRASTDAAPVAVQVNRVVPRTVKNLIRFLRKKPLGPT